MIMINVTKTYLPNINKYKSYVDRIFANGILTNNGPLVQELEEKLQNHLDVKNVILVANGTLALDVAYRSLNLTGEVITTPFTFIASASSIATSGLVPKFADIDPTNFNIDPKKIEPLINKKTTAIMPVHVFGEPCKLDEINDIAKKHNLKIVYDACHTFGINVTNKNGETKSILNYGDISTLSFHATKLFHTIEGGAIITNDDKLAQKIRLLINFGITGPTSIEILGINAKMNEFEAAMGLCILDDIEIILKKRKDIYNRYHQELKGLVQLQDQNIRSTKNFSYFPIVLKSEEDLLKIQKVLNADNIFPRRYFYPSLDTLDFLTDSDSICPFSQDISSRILCLPISAELEINDQKRIIEHIKTNLK
ncbi:DegT/DnrJ/EryC1/StrS family aminotransferase [Gammaproteobacteria bacterium]|nr:DegT/DnrJ/EryC1/StrS family aminotransferase [Gammaproteobacteria bacterium]